MAWTDLLGYAASLAVLTTFCVRTMLPLRIVALGSNVLFSTYGLCLHIYPVLALHLILLPVNLIRLIQVRRSIHSVGAVSTTGLSIDDLLPFMRRCRLRAGDVLFEAGAAADRLYYILDGSLEINELGIRLHAGDIVGEIGMLTGDHKRLATVTCRTDCELGELEQSKIRQMYFEDPAFGYAVLQLIMARLFEQIRSLEGILLLKVASNPTESSGLARSIRPIQVKAVEVSRHDLR